jgi:hypothetical protein
MRNTVLRVCAAATPGSVRTAHETLRARSANEGAGDS